MLPDSVAVIDPESDLVVADVPVGVRPEAVAADERSIWVANAADGTVSQIDIGKRRVVADDRAERRRRGARRRSRLRLDRRRRPRPGRAPGRRLRGGGGRRCAFPTTTTGIRSGTPERGGARHGLAVGGRRAQLAAVFRIDTASRRVTRARRRRATTRPGSRSATGAVWVADSTDNTVSRIVPAGAGAVTDTIPLGNGPGPIAAGEAAIWVANSRDGTVSRIDPATRAVEAVIQVGRLPSGIAVGAGAVWVANSLSGTVSRIDPRTNRVDEDDRRRRGAPFGRGGRRPRVGQRPGGPAASRRRRAGRRWRAWCSRRTPGRPIRVGLVDDAAPARDLRAAHDLREPQRLRCAELVPELATAPPAVSADGRVYTFRIRAGYRFSPPSGRPVTAAAFERAIERTLHPRTSSFGSGLLDDVAGAAGVPRRSRPHASRASRRAETGSRSG